MKDLANIKNDKRPKPKKKRHGFLIFLIVLFVIIIASGIILYSRYDYLIFEGDYYNSDNGTFLIRENSADFRYNLYGIPNSKDFQIIERDGDIYLVSYDIEFLVEVDQYTITIGDEVFEREDTNLPLWLEKIIYIFGRDIFLKLVNW